MITAIGSWITDIADRRRIEAQAKQINRRAKEMRLTSTTAVFDELSDLRASNARMSDVLSSIRDRLGMDDGGSILDAIDDLKAGVTG